MMTSLNDMPLDVLHKIMISDGMDVMTMCNMVLINKSISTMITAHWCEIIKNIFHYRFPEFACRINTWMLCQSNINLRYLYVILENIDKVSKMKKTAKYQHLLRHLYNGNLFCVKNRVGKARQDMEKATLSVLLALYEYVKDVYALANQPHKKTNLHAWALYPLLDYIGWSISTAPIEECVFNQPIFFDCIRAQIGHIEADLRQLNQASVDIRYRLFKLLGFLRQAFNPV